MVVEERRLEDDGLFLLFFGGRELTAAGEGGNRGGLWVLWVYGKVASGDVDRDKRRAGTDRDVVRRWRGRRGGIREEEEEESPGAREEDDTDAGERLKDLRRLS